MYKLLLFLKKSDEPQVIEHFNNFTLNHLSEVAGKNILAGNVESNILLDAKYSLYCEITVDSKEEWDNKMNTPQGRALGKDLMDFHQFIDVIFVNYK